jgi:hypothetical protein
VDTQRRLGIACALQDQLFQLHKFNDKLKKLAKVTTALQTPIPGQGVGQANTPKPPE